MPNAIDPGAAIRYYIDNAEFFKNASELTREKVAGICFPKHVSKKETLFIEGHGGDTVYLCGTASVQLYKTDPQGRPVVVRVLTSGELFAEVILFEQPKYPVSAEVIKSGIIYTIARRDFLDLLSDEQFRLCFFGDLMRKQKIRQITSCGVEQRLFFFLKEHYGEVENIKISLTKKNVADAIGTTPETVSRLIQRFKNDGSMVWEGDTIQLKKNFWAEWFKACADCGSCD